MAATLVVAVLYNREFRSRPLMEMRKLEVFREVVNTDANEDVIKAMEKKDEVVL